MTTKKTINESIMLEKKYQFLNLVSYKNETIVWLKDKVNKPHIYHEKWIKSNILNDLIKGKLSEKSDDRYFEQEYARISLIRHKIETAELLEETKYFDTKWIQNNILGL